MSKAQIQINWKSKSYFIEVTFVPSKYKLQSNYAT